MGGVARIPLIIGQTFPLYDPEFPRRWTPSLINRRDGWVEVKNPLFLVGSSHTLPGCSRKIGSMVRINWLFHLVINGVYWGYNPPTNLLLTSWDIQVPSQFKVFKMDGWNTSLPSGANC